MEYNVTVSKEVRDILDHQIINQDRDKFVAIEKRILCLPREHTQNTVGLRQPDNNGIYVTRVGDTNISYTVENSTITVVDID